MEETKMQKENKTIYKISLKELIEKFGINNRIIDIKVRPVISQSNPNLKLDLEKSQLIVVGVNEV